MWITTIHDKKNLPALVRAGANAILVGVEGLCIRECLSIPLNHLKEWKEACDAQGVFLYVNCMRLCMDEEIEIMREALAECKKLDIQGIYYADEGVLWEAKQLGIENKLIYQPETLVASSMDVNFYMEQGIQSVSLAHELSLDEIVSIARHTKDVEVLVHGYFSILYSRRPLITNYLEAIDVDAPRKWHRYDLIEQTREDCMPILEDEAGTYVFSSHPIQSLCEMDALKEAGVHRFRIDSLFFDDQWCIRTLEAYQSNTKIEDGSSDHWYHQETIKAKEY